MTESRSIATDRLRREGRWEEASLYRDEMRRKFKAEGLKRAEANEASWDAMLAKFAKQLPSETDNAAQAEAEQAKAAAISLILELGRAGEPDLPRDVNWVYGRLGDRELDPMDAPSLGAWSLWHWARGNRTRFFERMLPKALVVKQRGDEEEARHRRERERIEELKAMLAELSRDEDDRLAHDLATRGSTVVWELMAPSVGDWQHQFGWPERVDGQGSVELTELNKRVAALVETHVGKARQRAGDVNRLG